MDLLELTEISDYFLVKRNHRIPGFMPQKSVDIFNYLDSKEFVKDFLSRRKSLNRRHNYQYFSSRSGIKSPAQFSLILNGKIGITDKLIPKVCKAFELKKNESEYFKTLVHFNQAKSHQNKVSNFEKLLKLKHLKTKSLNKSQYEYFSQWYYVAIRELLDFYPFKGDYEALAKKLAPAITEPQARKSIQALEKNGLIRKNKDGIYVKTEAFIRPKEWERLALNKYLKSTIELGIDSLDRFEPKNRDVSALTLSLSKENFSKIKDEIKLFRAKLMEMANSDQNPDGVYQLNFTSFPLTELDEDEKSD